MSSSSSSSSLELLTSPNCDYTALSILEQYKPAATKQKLRVLLLTEVFNDGLGDYSNLLKVAYAVYRTVKGAEIFCLALIPKAKCKLIDTMESNNLHPFVVKRFPYVPCTSWDFIRSGPEPIKWDDATLAALETAEVSIEVSRPFGRWDSIGVHLAESIHRTAIPEYGCNHVFREGAKSGFSKQVIAKAIPDLEQHIYPTGLGKRAWYFMDPTLRDLATQVAQDGPRVALSQLTEPTRRALWGKDTDSWTSYLARRQPYFAYLQSTANLGHFTKSLVWRLRKSSKNIDIVCAQPLELAEKGLLDPQFLKSAGIKAVQFISDGGDKITNLSISGHWKHKVLRLIDTFPMPQSDVINLLAGGGKVAAVRGNGTLTEALSLGILPFFEKGPYWEEIFSTLSSLVKDEVTARDSAFLISYFDTLQGLGIQSGHHEWMLLGELMEMQEVWTAHAELMQCLWAHHDASHWLPGVIMRSYFLSGEPKPLLAAEQAVYDAQDSASRKLALEELQKQIGPE